jgi:hypothetical protein
LISFKPIVDCRTLKNPAGYSSPCLIKGRSGLEPIPFL